MQFDRSTREGHNAYARAWRRAHPESSRASQNATLYMMMEVLLGRQRLDTSGWDDSDLRTYIETVFEARDARGKRDSDIQATCDQVAWRLDGIFSESRTLRRIFSSSKNDLDMATLMDTPGVTVIHTNRALLTNEGAAFLGRVVLSLILRTAESTRAGKGGDFPCYVYIDEAHTIIKNDPNIIVIAD